MWEFGRFYKIMVMLFSIVVVSLLTALVMAPLTMFVGRVVLNEKPRFEQAFAVCFYASGSVWFVYSIVALYTEEQMPVVSVLCGFVAGHIAYAVALIKILACPPKRASLVGAALVILTYLVSFVGLLGVAIVFDLYDRLLS